MDAGRALAIVLVVLLHSEEWLGTAGVNVGWWPTIDAVASDLRMPLFFTISGLLATKWITARWPRLLSGKVTMLVWVYLAWQPIGLLAAQVADRITRGQQSPLHLLIALVATTVRPRSELWFLWALAVYFVLARVFARTRVLPQLLVAAVVSAVWLSGVVPDGNLGWNGVPKYYLFFLLGAHLRQPILWVAQRCRGARVLTGALIGGWTVVAVAVTLTGVEAVVGPGLVTAVIGLIAGIALAVVLARWRLIRLLGSRTLPIYLAHTPIIIVLALLVHQQVTSPWVTALAPALPLALTVIVVPVTLVLQTALAATPARILYGPPAAVTALVHKVATLAGAGSRSAAPHLVPSPSRSASMTHVT